jgi:copper resistance protein B
MASLVFATTGSAVLAAGGLRHNDGDHDGDHDGHTMLDSLRYTKFEMHELEWRDGGSADHGALNWDGELFHGSDLQRFGISSRGERSGGTTHEADIELLYRRAIAPFWDIDIGWRHDLQPRPKRDWLALGIHGEAPYGIDTELRLYLGSAGRSQLELTARYTLQLTQRLSLTPEIELALAGRDDETFDQGNGVTGVDGSLRLHYEITRKLAPYIGLIWQRASGDSAARIRAAGDDPEQTRFVAGVHFWL